MRCGIVGMGARSVTADPGITPTIAHASTGIVQRLPQTKGRFELEPYYYSVTFCKSFLLRRLWPGSNRQEGTISRCISHRGQLFPQLLRGQVEEFPEAQLGEIQSQQAVGRLI